MIELKQTEEKSAQAMEYFNNTRHIVLYYEDLLKNRTVITTKIFNFNLIHSLKMTKGYTT
jgi:hypothetical protein